MRTAASEVAAAMRGAGVTDVDLSTRRRAEYSTDASLYRVIPQAVVFPRSRDDIAAVLDVCRRLSVPLTMRGGGTSIAGNAVGPGVVLDISRHLTRILGIDPHARTATVEPGVVLDDLQRAAAPYGLRFGPDPSSHNRCTIGGMLGNNACGSRALAYGRTADNVVSLDVLTGAGEHVTATANTDPARSPTLTGLAAAVRADLGTIRTELGRFSRQSSGFALQHLLPENGFDVARALVGTEGTCALTLAATLRLVELPRTSTLVALGYADMATAADDVPNLLPLRPIAVEGLDSRIVDVVRLRGGSAAVPPLPSGGGWLFVEVGGDTARELAAAATAIVASSHAADARIVEHAGEAAQLWRIREDGAGLASRPEGGRSAYSGWEDAAVPPERLGAYLRDFDALLIQHGLHGVPYGHFGDGCLHVRLDFPLTAGGGAAAFRRFLIDAAHLVASYGGSMSGEHGDGRARSELLPIMYSPAALTAFTRVKRIFDPDDVLNPGVVVEPRPLDADLRRPAALAIRTRLAFAYAADDGDFAGAVHRCVGVGKCRADTTAIGGVMCPSFLATRDEKDSTRGRARVLQEMVNGSLITGGWRSPEVHDALELCLACKGCASDCPTGVDMATYKAEMLHQSYRGRLRPMSHYALGWLPQWSRLAARAPRVINALLSSPAAGLGKRLAGVDQRRALPRFAPQTFRRWFASRPATVGDPVVLWVDTFTDYFTPEVGRAAVRVLEAAGMSVQLPREGLCCGLPLISTGQLDSARKQLTRSVAALAPYVRGGTPIVGLEPSCVAVFRGDAAELLRGGEAAAVGASVRTLAEVLGTRSSWRRPDLTGVHVVAQPHCHHHAVMGWRADRALLEACGATVKSVDGCCGLAGNFGVERGHYDVSVAIAEHALLPAVRAADPADVVLADGFSCRTQLADLAQRPGVHLAELLATESGSSAIRRSPGGRRH